MPATLAAIYRYPVKGLTPERLDAVTLEKGATLPADRRYAIENGDSKFDPDAPVWRAKTHYLMLMRNARLAALDARFDDATTTLTIRLNNEVAAQGDLSTESGRAAIETFIARYCDGELRGKTRVLSSPGYSFSDVASKVVSIINLSSVAAVETMTGAAVDPLRFRGNLHVEGWPAWHEFDLMSKTLEIGEVRLKVKKRIVRCAAVNVDPVTAQRDLDIPNALMRELGHMDCGVYTEVMTGGTIRPGDQIQVL